MVGLFISNLDKRHRTLKRVVLLFAVAVMMAVMLLATAGLAMGAPGGNTANQTDSQTGNAQKDRTGGGSLNDPHVTGGFNLGGRAC